MSSWDDSTAPTVWPFVCPHCDQASNAAVRGTAYWHGDDASAGPPIEWSFIQCERCSQPSLQAREDFGGGFSDDDNPVTVYPAKPRLSASVPQGLRREWDEAQICFQAKAYSACVVMVRRALEGTCADQGFKERPLAKALKKMSAAGVIDETLTTWADTLRLVGNKGAHYTGQAVPREDAEDALAFAEALLDHVYVLRQRFLAFQQRLGTS